MIENALSNLPTSVASLAYVGIEAADPVAWATFAQEILGAQVTPCDNDNYFVRFDDHAQRVTVSRGVDGRLAYVGWNVRDAQDLRNLVERLDSHGIQWRRATEAECRARHVSDFIWFFDPDGNRTELSYGPDILEEPFRPFRSDLSGFVALGHLVLGVSDVKLFEAFYIDVLGFKLTDYIDYQPPKRDMMSISFLRCADGRNHSLAIYKGAGLDHLMVEVPELDDVGRTLGLCRTRGVAMKGNLGRHSNDLMVSFYLFSPNGLKIEYGYGGSYIDDATWQVRRINSFSLWGHGLN